MPSKATEPLETKHFRALLDRYRITDGKGFRLKHHDPADTGSDIVPHEQADAVLAESVRRLADLQYKLYASEIWALLCVLQGMDASGKDGAIRHVMSGVNPQGVSVTSFKQPGPEELRHDFLWRVARNVPMRGQIGIFNRSHYEEVLVVRVHPELLEHERIPASLHGHKFWQHRLEDIAAWERYLAHQGIMVCKFFLHLSRAEQRRRFLARLEEPEKNWKFSAADIAERAHWDAYMAAYEEAIAATATKHAPWYVVPADHKWFARLVVAAALIVTLEDLGLEVPHLPAEQHALLEAAKHQLEAED
jgi:PPK2 family polyphosphate:nucleotide phosphotransferase